MYSPKSLKVRHGAVLLLVAATGFALLFVTWCGGTAPVSPAAPSIDRAVLPVTPTPPATAVAPTATFVGAGDIAECGTSGSEETAKLLDGITGSVFNAGDSAYPTGGPEEFANCYGPTWGRHRARTYPTPGNHDWEFNGGAAYFCISGAQQALPAAAITATTLAPGT